jgi:type II secretory pathway component PulF
MARFRARIVGRSGRQSAISIDAIDMACLSEHIESHRRAYVIDITRIGGKRSDLRRTRISGGMLVAALDSLELMLASGVRINTALRTLAECAPDGAARRLWTEVAGRVEETGRFGESLREFPRVFNEPMVGMIVALEAAGRLPEGVRHVRGYVAQMRAIRRESVRGMLYPAIVCITGLAAAGVLCVFTIPRFSRMLEEIGVRRTNFVTGFFFSLSSGVVHHPLLAAAAPLAPGAVAWVALRPRFRHGLDRAILNMPVINRAVEALSLARICATFRALSESGIRVVEALEACAEVAGNEVYRRGISRVVRSVRDNSTVGEGFERSGVFAQEVVLAIKSGESALANVFGRLADYYSTEARHRVALALGLVEPLMMILVLLWVFGVALAVVLPLVEVINEIH